LNKRYYIFVFALIAATASCFAQDGVSNIEFVENKGQWDSRVNFRGEMSTGAFFLQRNGFTVLLHNVSDLQKLTTSHHGRGPMNGGWAGGAAGGGKAAPASVSRTKPGNDGGGNSGEGTGDVLIHSHAYRVTFAGANDGVTIIPDKPVPGVDNFFIGNDPSKWASDCKIYQGVTYKNIYPNIDVRYYTDEGQLKYEIIVHPGGNVDQIAMQYEGASGLEVRKGQLLVNTTVGQVKELAPVTYQFDQKGRLPVRSKFVVRNGNTVQFKVADFDANATLIIDPTLVFCTFTGSKVSNWGFTATPGPGGTFFAGGIVFGAAFPWNTGALQPTYGKGQFDVGIIKFNTSGSTKVYATYLGGADSETPHSMITDVNGNLVVLGRTYSTDFPYKTMEGSGGAADMFVALLDASGSKLTGCIRIGGSGNDCVNMSDQARIHDERADSLIRNYGDDSRSEVVLDGSNNILVAASTQSSDRNGLFPIRGAVFQPNFGGGGQDAVVLKIDPACNHIIWSSFLGGSGKDAAFVLKPDPLTGEIYVAGATTSKDLPGNKSGVLQSSYSGGLCDGFVSIISADGSQLKRTSYFGTPSGDAIYGIQFDKEGSPYIMGTTNGSWPTTQNVQFINPGAKQFVSKLKNDLSGYIFSTTFGSPNGRLPNISPVAFLVDRCENLYVSGWGGWILGGPDEYGLAGTIGMPVSQDAIKKLTDNRDFYFIVIKKNASALLYGTFYGQDDNPGSISEHVDGGTSRYDQFGIIYQAVCANCNGNTAKPFPTTPGVWSPRNGAGTNGCNLAAIKIAFNFAGVAAGLKASVNGRNNDTTGCVPMDAVFEDTIRNAKSYIWNFGDGGPDTATTGNIVSHTYYAPGFYRVMMVAIDSNSCNVRDTAWRIVSGRTDKANLDFSFVKKGDCLSLNYEFTNLSTEVPGAKPLTANSLVWYFSDKPSPLIPAGLINSTIQHPYGAPGTYIVKLILEDTGYCNSPDTLTKTLRVSPLAKAQFVTPPYGCVPYLASFDNTSLGGLQFEWDFGDPGSGAANTSTDPVPTHLYQNAGDYWIKLTVYDSTTCNKVSDTSIRITVSPRPTAAFTFSPSPPVTNTPMVFNNGSVGAVRYKWDFGDGDTLMTTTMDTIEHLYKFTDSFNVCLVAFNRFDCTDTVCHTVATLINPLLDMPNAFTPGRFGQNGVFKVAGFGITKLMFRIYNRWGQLVFQSSDQNIGWDGNYQGNPQPMGVYAYTLEAEFSNGKHASRKGDLTLLR